MMNPRRYEVRAYMHGSRILTGEKILIGLDLTTGHGIQAASVELDRMLMRIVGAARIREKDIKHCRVEVFDEETNSVAWNFYPAPD